MVNTQRLTANSWIGYSLQFCSTIHIYTHLQKTQHCVVLRTKSQYQNCRNLRALSGKFTRFIRKLLQKKTLVIRKVLIFLTLYHGPQGIHDHWYHHRHQYPHINIVFTRYHHSPESHQPSL